MRRPITNPRYLRRKGARCGQGQASRDRGTASGGGSWARCRARAGAHHPHARGGDGEPREPLRVRGRLRDETRTYGSPAGALTVSGRVAGSAFARRGQMVIQTMAVGTRGTRTGHRAGVEARGSERHRHPSEPLSRPAEEHHDGSDRSMAITRGNASQGVRGHGGLALAGRGGAPPRREDHHLKSVQVTGRPFETHRRATGPWQEGTPMNDGISARCGTQAHHGGATVAAATTAAPRDQDRRPARCGPNEPATPAAGANHHAAPATLPPPRAPGQGMGESRAAARPSAAWRATTGGGQGEDLGQVVEWPQETRHSGYEPHQPVGRASAMRRRGAGAAMAAGSPDERRAQRGTSSADTAHVRGVDDAMGA